LATSDEQIFAIVELKLFLAEENITLNFEIQSEEEANRFADVLRYRILAMADGISSSSSILSKSKYFHILHSQKWFPFPQNS
jgi:hypothetical protein